MVGIGLVLISVATGVVQIAVALAFLVGKIREQLNCIMFDFHTQASLVLLLEQSSIYKCIIIIIPTKSLAAKSKELRHVFLADIKGHCGLPWSVKHQLRAYLTL